LLAVPQVLVATPLKHMTRPYDFGDGISIQELSPILWDVSLAKTFISSDERDKLANTRYWLCASRDVEHFYPEVGGDLYDHARYAMWALQILCPSGARNVYLKFDRTEAGYDNVGTQRPKELCSTLMGRITSVEDRRFVEDFDAVYSLVKRAFTQRVVRLQNPILLLEHGMQICNVNLGTLMFVMALDMLMMAGEKSPFVERLGGFLGPESHVFSPDFVMRRQPAVKVKDVVSDLFDFRNVIAHGREIPKAPFREKYDLVDDRGVRINSQDYYYSELMLESGLFLLADAMRKIAVEGLFDDITDPAKWRSNLRTYEHRCKNSVSSISNNRR
jgi:hypothetical protein